MSIEHHRTLPAKRMAAAVRFVDRAGRTLIVKPTYRDVWLLPGGVVEAEESPRQAAHREVQEELGLDRVIGELMCVEHVPSDDDYLESVMWIFDGGALDDDTIADIRLDHDELAELRFVDDTAAQALLTSRLARRLRFALADPGCYVDQAD